MKKIKKVLITIIIAVIIFSFIDISMASVIQNNFGGSSVSGTKAGGKVKSLLSSVLEIVRNIGIGVAIIMLIALACKYMIASASDRAEIKKHAVAYVTGAVVLFAASGILTIIKDFAVEVTK